MCGSVAIFGGTVRRDVDGGAIGTACCLVVDLAGGDGRQIPVGIFQYGHDAMGKLRQLRIGQRDVQGFHAIGDLKNVTALALILNAQAGDQMGGGGSG